MIAKWMSFVYTNSYNPSIPTSSPLYRLTLLSKYLALGERLISACVRTISTAGPNPPMNANDQFGTEEKEILERRKLKKEDEVIPVSFS